MTGAPILLGPGEGEDISGRIRIKCDRDELALTETVGASETSPHVHDRHVDAFYVLEGDFTVMLGEEEFALAPGDFALVPPGMVHRFRSQGGRWLNVHAPQLGFAEYLRSGRGLRQPRACTGRRAASERGRATPPGRG